MRLIRRLVSWVPGAAIALFMCAGHAQEFPSRPVRMVVPFPPSGPVDWMGRSLGAQLEKRWHQPVVIENRTGAGGYAGSEQVARAEPDGHTLLAQGNALGTYNLFLKDARLDMRSFAPLSMIMKTPWIVVVPSVVDLSSVASSMM